MAARADDRKKVDALLDRYGTTYSEELGLDAVDPGPSDLFRLLTASLLASARISGDLAVRGARALAEAGWTTVERMAASSWSDRARTLNEAGYARYDERTATMLGETADLVLERWDGDLRNLRAEAERDPGTERRLLKRCKGIGDAGVDIFFREIQDAWREVRPFVDRRAAAGAKALALPDDPDRLADLVKGRFAPLAAALVRVDRQGDADEILAVANGDAREGDGGHTRDRAASAPSDLTRDELYERAKQLDIPGRSRMRKSELAEAVRNA